MLSSVEPQQLAPPPPATFPAAVAARAPKRVLAITSNLLQASSRLRVAALVEPLRRRGFEVEVFACPRTWSARRELLRSAETYHAVLLQRKLLDPWNWHVLRRHARRVVFDVDDAVRFHPARVGPYSRVRTALRFGATRRNVDHVVAGNAYVADLFPGSAAVDILPTAIRADDYRVKRHAQTDAPTLVWIGSRSTLPYLAQFMPALEAAADLVPNLRLVTIADRIVSSKKIRVEHVAWSLDAEAESLCLGDIGIAPTPLDRWTLGKCGFKILQYMAAGLPVLASPVGANRELVRHGDSGLLVEHPTDWPRAIATLAADVDLRRRMGTAGRRLVEANFDVEDAADVWARILST